MLPSPVFWRLLAQGENVKFPNSEVRGKYDDISKEVFSKVESALSVESNDARYAIGSASRIRANGARRLLLENPPQRR
jgi:hypothetical protein